jgi:putative sterol carrier protein
MAIDLFSPSGITAWQQRLNHSAAFAAAAKSWAGRLLLIENRDGNVNRTTWVVVGHGRCAEARTGLPSDELSADYVLSASPETWMDLVTARHTPAAAALLGRLTLLKGSVMSLVPHAKAAAELLAAAAGGTS